MELGTEMHGSDAIITPAASRIDAVVAIKFKDRMRDITRDVTGRVILNLDRVEFVDSSGLGAIVAAMKQLDGDRPLELAALQPAVAKVFRLTRMDSVFPIHDDAATAMAARSG